MQHPGLELKALIKRGGFTQKHVAQQLEVQASQLNEILNGKRSLTAGLCLALERAFGLNALDWNRKQADYDLNQARLKTPSLSKSQPHENCGIYTGIA